MIRVLVNGKHRAVAFGLVLAVDESGRADGVYATSPCCEAYLREDQGPVYNCTGRGCMGRFEAVSWTHEGKDIGSVGVFFDIKGLKSVPDRFTSWARSWVGIDYLEVAVS